MKKLVSLVGVLVLLLSACSNNSATDKKEETVKVTHELGEVEVVVNPSRVIVHDFGALDTLNQLGYEDEIVGVVGSTSAKTEALTKYMDEDVYANTGTLFEPDLEVINSLNPDVIFIGGRTADFYEELSKIAPVVLMDNDATKTYMENFTVNLTNIGKIFNEEKTLTKYLDDFNNRLDVINKKVTSEEYNALVSILSSRTLSALTPAGKASMISNEAGFDNIAKGTDSSTHGLEITYEYVLEEDPDYIFVLDRNAATGNTEYDSAKEQVENELVKATQAYKNGNIVYLSPYEWYLMAYGLASTEVMVSELEAAIK